MSNKIKMLVIPSDREGGIGKFRSIDPHVLIANKYRDEFDIDIVFDMPHGDLESFFKQYDLIHIHKQLDENCQVMDMIKFLGIPVIVDIDDYFYLGNDHPMSISAKKGKWHVPVINHLKKADYVTTTTPIFAKELRKINKNVAVFPNAISLEDRQFSTLKTKGDGRLRVGIICGSTHLKDLELLNGIAKQVDKDKVQFVLCGFDTRGRKTIFDENGNSRIEPIKPQESVWCDFERIFTDNYANVSKEHKIFLDRFVQTDDPFTSEPYRRMWTRNIKLYGTHYANVDVLIAPLKENDFNKFKSELKEVECGFTNTAFIAQDFGAYTLNLKPMIEKGGKINEDGTALLVPSSKNHKLWAKYINKLADDREMLSKLQKNLHDFVIDNYSLEKICEERVKLYKEIAKKH